MLMLICIHTLRSFSISSITFPLFFDIIVDKAQQTSHVPWSCPSSSESCWWLNDSCYNEQRLPSFCLTPLSQLFSLLFPSLYLGASSQYQLHHHCFWTFWAWNKDTVLLYSIQYRIVKYTKAQPLVEDARTWQYTPDTWTNVIRHSNTRSHLWKFATWRFVCLLLATGNKKAWLTVA